MASQQHRELTEMAARWFKRKGFPIVATELTAVGCREQPDAVAFRTNCSAIIEAKCSRADFFADRKKPERMAGGLGVYRFYLCPEGLIKPEDLPPRWGLLWAAAGSVQEIQAPRGNAWPAFNPEYPYGDWKAFMHEPDYIAERIMMFSIARRMAKGACVARR